MKTIIFYLIIFFVFAIPAQAQLLVQDTGNKQVESTIAVNPNNPNIMAKAVIELLIPSGRQCVIWISTNGGSTWIQKKIVDNAADPVMEFDNNGNLFFAYLSKSDDEIYIIKSNDIGQNWTSALQVSNTNGIADKEWLTIDRNTNYIYLTWKELDS